MCDCGSLPTHGAHEYSNNGSLSGLVSAGSCSICDSSSPDVKLRTVEELIEELDTLVNEKSATMTQKRNAIRRAINELANIPAYQYCVPFDFACGQCEYDLPCCGITDIIPQVAIGCNSCFEDIPKWDIDCGKLVVPETISGYGRLLVNAHNSYAPDAIIAAYMEEVGCEYHVYIQGQPEIPNNGFFRLCDQDFFYRCKSGYVFPELPVISSASVSVVVDSEDGIPVGEDGYAILETPDFSHAGLPRPCGQHTVLYAHPVSNCGRILDLPKFQKIRPDSVLSFTIGYEGQQYADLLVAIAASTLYLSLTSSCSTDRDLQRYAGMQKFYAEETSRIKAKLPRFSRHKIVNYNTFKTVSGPGYMNRQYRYQWPFGR